MLRRWDVMLKAVTGAVLALAVALSGGVSSTHILTTIAESPVGAVESESAPESDPESEVLNGWEGRTAKSRARAYAGDSPSDLRPTGLLLPPSPSRCSRPVAPRFVPPSPDLLVLIQRFTC